MRKEPTVQAPLGGYVIDFLCHDPPLAIEIDGPVHRQGEQAAFDRERDEAIKALGYMVMRIDERMVRNRIDDALRMITEAGARAASLKRLREREE